MVYRRSKEKIQAAQAWATFVDHNREQFLAAGLPELMTKSISHWDHFLMHGYLDEQGDLNRFTIDQLSEKQYWALFKLVESYFVFGYEYFEPNVLRSEDKLRLKHRFS